VEMLQPAAANRRGARHEAEAGYWTKAMGRGRSATTTALMEAARNILATIQPCSVRAVAYQLFTRGLIPSMEKRR
jgi:hypothetical protein